MERYAWKGRIKPGMRDEYRRRHDEIWPEMKAMFRKAGIRNYTIWTDGETLFGYYECERGVAYARAVQAECPVVARWNAWMADVLELDVDPATGKARPLTEIFRLD